MPAFLDQQHLLALARDVARLCVWLMLLTLIFVPLERLFAVHPKKFFSKTLAQDVGYYFVNGIIPGLLLAVPLSLAAWVAHNLVPWSVQTAVAAWPLWLRIVVAMLVAEVGFYWGHRACHEIPFLWRFHSIHHSAEHVYFLISARAHPLDNVFNKLCGLIPVYILGVADPITQTGSIVPTLIMLLVTLWGFFIHSNLRWRFGPLEWVIATPAFHLWHHTRDEHRDRNYSPTLPWVDRIFGTYYVPRNRWPSAYGIETKLPASLAAQTIYPFRAPEPRSSPVEPIVADR